MADSRLLLLSKARDDYEFRARISTALVIHATTESQSAKQTANSKLFSNYVLSNPAAVVDTVFNIVISTPSMANKVKKVADKIDTGDITDEEILGGIAALWEWLAAYVVSRNYSL